MRSSLVLYLAFAAAAAACGTDNAGQPQPDAGSGGDAALGAPDLDVISKDVTLDPHQEVTYCYYFHTPNTSNLAIKKWVSDMTDGSHHMIMFFDSGGGSPPPDGTLDSQNCGFGGGAGGTTSFPVWVYASQTMHGELDLPADDGTGKPLGMDVPPNTAAYFQMHYLNPGDTPIVAHVHLQGFAHPAGTTYTKTAAYITYNGNISIAPNAMNFAETQTCAVPPNVKFWTLSTHAHKQEVTTDVLDGTTNVFHSTDWEHPGAKTWTAPFYTFASNALTYTCTYNNVGSNVATTITDGPSAQTNEMCMATGYYFPAPKPRICYTNFLIP